MGNLIITVISIIIAAIVAVMGVYYGGQVYQTYQANAWVNAMVQQSQQINAAAQLYATNNGGDYNSFGFSDLVNNGYLSNWPNVGLSGTPSGFTGGSGTITTSSADKENITILGEAVGVQRQLSNINGTNVVAWYFNDPSGQFNTGSAASANVPLGQICNAINKIYGLVPTNGVTASGVPNVPVGGTGNLHINNYQGQGVPAAAASGGTGPVYVNACYPRSSTQLDIALVP